VIDSIKKRNDAIKFPQPSSTTTAHSQKDEPGNVMPAVMFQQKEKRDHLPIRQRLKCLKWLATAWQNNKLKNRLNSTINTG